MPRRLPALLAGLTLLGAASVQAEHEVYYRYVVVGYVRDAQGLPLHMGVEVVRDKTGLSYLTETDDDGLFVVIVRLGDESVGETLTLRVGELRTRVMAQFDPANHAEDRGTRVDLEAARFIERPTAFRSTLARVRGDGER